jgi:aerobic-type carbon monoxide dehydrogenase small subunit (CoxS/CutS family)
MANVTVLNVNGTDASIDADGERTLLSVLRDDLDLTGSKYGCGEGRCGACTVLLNGSPVRSCQLPVGSVGQRKIVTIESLDQNGQLHPLQAAFLKYDAFQCGYCTCGMIMSGVAFLQKRKNPSDAEIIRFMDGNVCRCGAYQRIVAAIKDAAKSVQGAAQ